MYITQTHGYTVSRDGSYIDFEISQSLNPLQISILIIQTFMFKLIKIIILKFNIILGERRRRDRT